jgi:hypothetical protein
MSLSWKGGVALFATALLTPAIARAGAFDVEGFGPVGIAEINARAASADDGTATFYNPGGLAFGTSARTELAPQLGISALTANGNTLSLSSPFGISTALDTTIPFEGALKDRVRFGFGAYLLPTSLGRILSHAESEPFFPYYDNRTQRIVLMPAIAVRAASFMGLGLALNVLGGVQGPADVRPGPSGVSESRLDLTAPVRVAFNAGIRVDLASTAHLAFVYRQRFQVTSSVTTTARVAGIPLDLDVSLPASLFDPHTFVLATSVDLGKLSLEVDGSLSLWSGYEGPFVRVKAELPGANLESDPPPSNFRDVVSVRAAAGYPIKIGDHELTLRGGLGFEPSMLTTAPQARQNLLDGDKYLLGLGATFAPASPSWLRISAGFNTQVLSATTQFKDACIKLPCPPDTVVGPDPAAPSVGIDNPGYPTLHGEGAFFSGSIGLGVLL